MGAEKVVTISEREGGSKRHLTLRTMRSLIRFGKTRPRDFSGDEEQGLLDVAAGPSSEPDRPISQTSISSDEILVDTRSPKDTPKHKKRQVYSYNAYQISIKKFTNQTAISLIFFLVFTLLIPTLIKIRNKKS